MLYLSDPIYIERNFEKNNVGSYLSYSVHIRPIGVNPNTYTKEPYKQIYQGHIYVTGQNQRIYLNDIITPHLYDHSYIKPQISIDTDGNCIGMVKSEFDYPVSNVRVRVEYDGNFPYDEIDVLQYYADNQEHDVLSENIEEDDNSLIINLLNLRTYVYPRVPRIDKVTNKFWVGAKFMITKGLWDSSNERCLEWTALDPEDKVKTIATRYIDEDEQSRSQYAWNITGADYMQLSRINGKNFGITNTFSSSETKIGELDDCPSDFYLIWMDRTGAYQCQPFNKKTIRKENINTTNIINSIEETRPILKSVTNTWILNSDWLNFDEYRAYESIFTSPYLYLYDYKNDEGYWVNCTNKSWEEKNSSNTKKPFNLTINLESNQSQNIMY